MSNYYDLSKPYSIEDWNRLLRDVNIKLQNPPEGDESCKPIDPIDEVTDPHIWSVDDVSPVQDKLIETCPDISFSEPLEIWKPEIIDEIGSALEKVWCDCCTEEFKHSEEGTIIEFANYEYTIYHGCSGGELPQPPDIDVQTLEGMPIGKPGLKGRFIGISYDPKELWGGNIHRAININCDGTLSKSSFKIKGSHGRTPWCPELDWDSCCGNPVWVFSVLDKLLERAETVENLVINFEIFTKYAFCADCNA